MSKAGLLLMGVAATGVIAISTSVRAAPIVEGPGAFTYTYHAGTDIPDANAATSGTSFNVETPAQGNAAYYYTSTSGSTGTVTYVFQATPGDYFSGNLTTQEQSLVAFNPGGSVKESVNGSAAVTLLSASDGGFYTDDTAHMFNVQGATTVTVVYTLANPSGNPIFTQAFRETNGDTSTPLLISGTVLTPEPASFGILGAAGLLALRRRRA